MGFMGRMGWMGKLERTRRMDDKVGTFREAMKAVEAGILTCYVG